MPVFVVGSVNVDVALPVEQLPPPGSTILAGDPVRSGGGKGANVAVAAARDGAQVRLVAAVGDDDPGRRSLGDLRADGVDVTAVATLAGRPTGLAMICIDPAGENFVVVAPGANSGLSPAHVARGLRDVQPGDVCVVNFEIPDDAIAETAKIVGERGARLIVNPSPVRAFGDELLAGETTLVVNAGELERLTGERDLTAGCAALARRGASAVVVTLGADGVHVSAAAGDDDEHLAAFPASPADTTGAGDTFTGVLAGALAAGTGLVTAARRGAAAAALSTERIGARAAMPRAADTDRLLRARQA